MTTPEASRPRGRLCQPNLAPKSREHRSGLVFLVLALECGAKDIAQCGAGIGGAILGNRLLLLGHFKRLDRQLDLAGATVELDHASVDLLSNLEAVGALIVAIAGELGALDER